MVDRSFAWATRFRRLVKDYERYAETLAGLYIVASHASCEAGRHARCMFITASKRVHHA